MAAKRNDGAPRDPVARFHLANGALVERLDWLADPTARGLEQSFGVMVNYRYALDRIAPNQLAYAATRTVDAAPPVRALAAADPTVLDESPPAISRRAALLAAIRSVASRAKRIVVRAPAQA